MHTLIIGSGLAGITLAREIRKLDKERPITIISADNGDFYSKPNLSNAFAAGKHPDALTLTPAVKLAADLNVTLLSHTVVAAIDAKAKEVVYPQGRLGYDQLILAVGASQIPLPLPGNGVPGVMSVNSLADYARLRESLIGKQSIAIIGAGLIGCEFANDLRIGGFDVALYDLESLPLARLLSMSAANTMRSKLEAIGVAFHLATRLIAIERSGNGFSLVDHQGNTRKYDLVLSAIGLRPNLGLAKSANLETRMGILTDSYLRTSDPNIFALGDCIEIAGQYLPYVMPIMQGAKKLAATLTGNPEGVTYPAMPIVVKTPACPTVISPPATKAGHWEEEVTPEGIRGLYIDSESGKACGFVLLGTFTKERMALTAQMPGLELG